MTVRPATAGSRTRRVSFEPARLRRRRGHREDGRRPAPTPSGLELAKTARRAPSAREGLGRGRRRLEARPLHEARRRPARSSRATRCKAVLERAAASRCAGDVKLGARPTRRRRRRVLARHESEPLSTLLYALGKNSDNFYAEMIFKSIAAEAKPRPREEPGRARRSSTKWIDEERSRRHGRRREERLGPVRREPHDRAQHGEAPSLRVAGPGDPRRVRRAARDRRRRRHAAQALPRAPRASRRPREDRHARRRDRPLAATCSRPRARARSRSRSCSTRSSGKASSRAPPPTSSSRRSPSGSGSDSLARACPALFFNVNSSWRLAQNELSRARDETRMDGRVGAPGHGRGLRRRRLVAERAAVRERAGARRWRARKCGGSGSPEPTPAQLRQAQEVRDYAAALKDGTACAAPLDSGAPAQTSAQSVLHGDGSDRAVFRALVQVQLASLQADRTLVFAGCGKAGATPWHEHVVRRLWATARRRCRGHVHEPGEPARLEQGRSRAGDRPPRRRPGLPRRRRERASLRLVRTLRVRAPRAHRSITLRSARAGNDADGPRAERRRADGASSVARCSIGMVLRAVRRVEDFEVKVTTRPDGIAVVRVPGFLSSLHPLRSPSRCRRIKSGLPITWNGCASRSNRSERAGIVWDARSNTGGSAEVALAIVAGFPGAKSGVVSKGFKRVPGSSPFALRMRPYRRIPAFSPQAGRSLMAAKWRFSSTAHVQRGGLLRARVETNSSAIIVGRTERGCVRLRRQRCDEGERSAGLQLHGRRNEVGRRERQAARSERRRCPTSPWSTSPPTWSRVWIPWSKQPQKRCSSSRGRTVEHGVRPRRDRQVVRDPMKLHPSRAMSRIAKPGPSSRASVPGVHHDQRGLARAALEPPHHRRMRVPADHHADRRVEEHLQRSSFDEMRVPAVVRVRRTCRSRRRRDRAAACRPARREHGLR